MTVIIIILLIILLIKTYSKRRIFILSPVDIFIFYFVLCILFSCLYHFYWPEKEKINFYGFDKISDKKLYRTLLVFLKMLLFFILGVNFFLIVKKSYSRLSKIKIELIPRNFAINFSSSKFVFLLIIILFFSTFLVFYDFGTEIFRRAEYIPNDKAKFKFIYQNSFFLVSIIAGLIYKKHKIISFLSLFISLILSLSIGSRYATLYLIAYGLTYSLFLNKKSLKIFLLFFIPFVFLFFGFNLSLRSRSYGHGLIPYFQSVVNNPEIIFIYSIKNFYYTFIFGFFATTQTLILYKNATIENLNTALSPLFGFMTRWPFIANNMRCNIYQPYTSIGEMGKFPIFSMFYYFIIGIYFSFIDNFIKNQIIIKKYFFAITQLLLLSLFIIFSFEYNLRSSQRFIYYSVLLYFIYHIFNFFKRLIYNNAKK